MGKAARIAFMGFTIAVVIAAAINVYGDDSSLRLEAEGVACPRGCPKTSSVSYERTPFAETISYTQPGGVIQVRCARAAILVGPYFCAKE